MATSFTDKHLWMLAQGPKDLPKCQSHFSSHFGLEDIIEREFQLMSSVITKCLAANLFLISLKLLVGQLHA